ncbi:hypothetical protein FIU84_03960 [Stutzerimonas frequens]|nr:hypothetical protein FIU84_03960 [Stutzerimonas frequens]
MPMSSGSTCRATLHIFNACFNSIRVTDMNLLIAALTWSGVAFVAMALLAWLAYADGERKG